MSVAEKISIILGALSLLFALISLLGLVYFECIKPSREREKDFKDFDELITEIFNESFWDGNGDEKSIYFLFNKLDNKYLISKNAIVSIKLELMRSCMEKNDRVSFKKEYINLLTKIKQEKLIKISHRKLRKKIIKYEKI